MRPKPYKFRPIPTLWADYTTGQGVLSNGQSVKPKIGQGRKNPNLQDMLDTAAAAGAERIMFTGNVPDNDREKSVRNWLLVQTPGWNAGWVDNTGNEVGHWLGTPVTGRFERISAPQRVEVKTAAEWFGNTPLSPEQARQAWDATSFFVGQSFKDQHLGKTPASTGTNLWAASLPFNLDPEQVTDDIADDLHRTSGQHHLEHLVAGPSFSTHEDCLPLIDPATQPRMEKFAYVDGRFMYAALCRELGVGPGVRLNKADTITMLNQDPYARARVLVRFKVPENWNHVGLLGVQHAKYDDGWYYPNRPGAMGETWADTAELHVAKKAGWLLDPLESVVFNKHTLNKAGEKVSARPLDTFANRIIKIREQADEDPEMPLAIKAAVGAALRAIMIQTIGAFSSRGRSSSKVVWSSKEVPPEYLSTVKRAGPAYIYKVPTVGHRRSPYYHPELAAQVWARGRARVLLGPSSLGADTAGALTVPPNTLMGINGDAIYTSFIPQWSLPAEHGGGDDGKMGRLRLQGVLENVKTPATKDERNRLRVRAVKAGTDSAFFDAEFNTPED